MPKPPLLPIWSDDAVFTSGTEIGEPTKFDAGAAYTQGLVPGAHFRCEFNNFYSNALAKWAAYLNGLEGEALTWTATQIFSNLITISSATCGVKVIASGTFTSATLNVSGTTAATFNGPNTLTGTLTNNTSAVWAPASTTNFTVTGATTWAGDLTQATTPAPPNTISGNVVLSFRAATSGAAAWVVGAGFITNRATNVTAGNASVTGTAAFNNAAGVALNTGSLVSSGKITVGSNGLVVNTGGLAVLGNSSVTGTLNVTSTTTVSSGAAITGAITANTGTTTATGVTSSSGTSTFTGTVTTSQLNVTGGDLTATVFVAADYFAIGGASARDYRNSITSGSFGNNWSYVVSGSGGADGPRAELTAAVSGSGYYSIDFNKAPGTVVTGVEVLLSSNGYTGNVELSTRDINGTLIAAIPAATVGFGGATANRAVFNVVSSDTANGYMYAVRVLPSTGTGTGGAYLRVHRVRVLYTVNGLLKAV